LIGSWFENGKEESVSAAKAALRRTLATEGESETIIELVQRFLDDVMALDGLRSEFRQLLAVGASAKVTLYPVRETQPPEGFVLTGKKNIPLEFTDEDDRSSQTVEIGLESHCFGVGNFADCFAQGAGLPQKMAEDVALAARLHDLGKADLRFQSWLRGGRRLSPREQKELLAKSSMPATDWQASQRARRAARYPKGARHECYSVAMIEKSAKLLEQAHDRELVIYLVGTHHGRGRPFLPAVNDPGMPLVRLSFAGNPVEFHGQHGLEGIGAGWTERFWQLIRRYGYWGLAYMETLLRLADHRRSEQEMEK
jgi:CRISPR-associated endonuclease/helicase Cas3